MTPTTPRKRKRTTVGHISVPDLPGCWPGRMGARAKDVGGPPASAAIDLLREADNVYWREPPKESK